MIRLLWRDEQKFKSLCNELYNIVGDCLVIEKDKYEIKFNDNLSLWGDEDQFSINFGHIMFVDENFIEWIKDIVEDKIVFVEFKGNHLIAPYVHDYTREKFENKKHKLMKKKRLKIYSVSEVIKNIDEVIK